MSQYFLHFGNTGFQLGPFGTDRRINIAYPPAFFRNQIDGTGQQNLAVNILELACRIGE